MDSSIQTLIFVQITIRLKLILKILFIGLPFFYSGGIAAQKITLTPQENFNIQRDDFAVLGLFQNNIAVYFKENEKNYIILYSKQLQKLKSIPMEFIPKSNLKVQIYNTSESFLVFYEMKEGKKKSVYASKMKNDDTWTEPMMIDSNPVNAFKDVDYEYHISVNHSKVLVYTHYYVDENQVLKAEIIDESLAIVKSINQLIQDKSVNFTNEAAISNEGIPFIITSESAASKGVLEDIKVLACQRSQQEFLSYAIPMNKHSISNLNMYLDEENQNLYLTGFYGDGRFSSPKGIYFSVFDTHLQAQTISHFTPVSLTMSSRISDLKDLKIKHVSVTKDAGVEIVAERTYQTRRILSSANPMLSSSFMPLPDQTRTVIEFYYDELAIFNLKNDGTMPWNQVVLKDQMTTDDSGIYSSFGLLEYPLGKVYLFNDLGASSNRFIASYVSNSGNVNIKEVQTSDEIDDWSLLPRSGVQTSKSEIIIPAIKKNYLCFIKLSF